MNSESPLEISLQKYINENQGCVFGLDAVELAFRAGWEARPIQDGASEPTAKCLGDVTPEMIYRAYPRKVGKVAALKAIEKAINRLTYIEDYQEVVPRLLTSVEAYAKAVAQWPEGEKQFVPHPASWFNAGRYEDDPKEWIKHTKQVPGTKVNLWSNK